MSTLVDRFFMALLLEAFRSRVDAHDQLADNLTRLDGSKDTAVQAIAAVISTDE